MSTTLRIHLTGICLIRRIGPNGGLSGCPGAQMRRPSPMANINAANNVHAVITTSGMVGNLLFTTTSPPVSPVRAVIWTCDVTEIQKQIFSVLQDNLVCRICFRYFHNGVIFLRGRLLSERGNCLKGLVINYREMGQVKLYPYQKRWGE